MMSFFFVCRRFWLLCATKRVPSANASTRKSCGVKIWPHAETEKFGPCAGNWKIRLLASETEKFVLLRRELENSASCAQKLRKIRLQTFCLPKNPGSTEITPLPLSLSIFITPLLHTHTHYAISICLTENKTS